MKFRKKPVIIEAFQWKDGKVSEMQDWIREALDMNKIMRFGNDIHIQTLEGIMVASDGDWIIKGIKGELYPCKPDIFLQTYEFVDQ